MSNSPRFFGGKEIKTWAQLKEAGVLEGTGCLGEITRVMRKEGSGTTYQFKNYLATLQAGFGGKAMPCALAGGIEEDAEGNVIGEPAATTTRKNMRHVAAKAGAKSPNTTWPEPSNCEGTTEVVRKVGGAGVAEFVATTNGTIGYAALPDAEAKGADVAQLEDAATPRFAGPLKTGTTESNCGPRVYTVPIPGREGETGEAVNWSQVLGAAPSVGGGLYPLCTLTYDIAWKSYAAAGYGPEPAKIAANVKSYMQYLISSNGQKVLSERFSQPLPKAFPSNVLAAAELAISKIG